jgi:endonuclease YncB( thermonuclease family)
MGNCLILQSSGKNTEQIIKIEASSNELNTQNHFENFKDKTFDNCNSLFEKGYRSVCRVVDIYDGDTCTVILYYNLEYIKFSVRLNGIDTCEIKSKNNTNKNSAYLARNRLFNLITNKTLDKIDCKRKEIRQILNDNVYLIKIDVHGFDKYGRLLADLYDFNGNNFSKILIEEKLAYVYDGKTKLSEKEQSDIII